jgi:predicted nucleotidyltransferase
MKTKMFPTPYQELNQVLAELVVRIQGILENDFVGAYLQGSFAVGDYDQHSDVDFIVVVEDELTSRQVDALQVMHDQVYELESEWAKHLEGSYFPREVLRHLSKRGQDLWYLDHGARTLIRSDHCNTILVRWIVREKGISLAGPPPKTLVNPISKELLRAEIFETLSDWAYQILDTPTPYNNRFYQAFIVLSYCRMLHDLHRCYPGSKREGAEWAKINLDPSWSDLIDGSWDGRPDPAKKVRQPADPDDFKRTLEFVQYIVGESRNFFAGNACDKLHNGTDV